ncbi:MAG: hypothetical protein WCG93_00040 [Paludibacter sp.]
MGYINEPEGIDFFVDPKPLTKKDREEISNIIAYYKATGRKKRIVDATLKSRTLQHKRQNSRVDS